MKLLTLFIIFLFVIDVRAFSSEECHKICVNPNHPDCVNSGSQAPKEIYYPFLSMLKSVPGTQIDFKADEGCARTTTVNGGVFKNSGSNCLLKTVQFAYFINLNGQYKGRISDGSDQDGHSVKQLDFSSAHLPEFYAKDGRGTVSNHYGKETIIM